TKKMISTVSSLREE
ncbi:hypothetical protein MIMGU_mgv1a0146013mg, partial [Erythranthe guttata]